MAGLHPAISVFHDAISRLKARLPRAAFFLGSGVTIFCGCPVQEAARTMSEPLVVVIPHRLGKDEARRRIEGGFGRAKTEFAHLIRIERDTWEGDRLSFAASALGQHAAGFIDVYENAVRLEVTLPWLLARFAHAVQRVVGKRGQLLLEKK
jgi:Putative polyhydroxyalkanoic acid system protein (PHA_gran_rgn)